MSSFCCNKCGKTFDVELPSKVNVAANPELKEKILNGEFFLHQCPHCSELNMVKSNMLYMDPEHSLLLCLSENRIASAGEVPGFTCRLVNSVGEMIEKIKIFDCGLDDVAMEMCKYVTGQEMGKKVDLKFYSMQGADNELVFAYPQDSQMQMIAVGLNVYQDCCAIISRNPQFIELSKGLVKIDQEWLSEYVG